MTVKPPKLLDQLREYLRYKHYSLSTETLYVYWNRFFIRWSGPRHPRDMGAADIEAFLTMLVKERSIFSSTHRQALSAILFLYKEELKIDLPWLQEIGRPKEQKHLPVGLTKHEFEKSRKICD